MKDCISEEEIKQYGIYLADVVKIRKLIESIPIQHLESVVKPYLEKKKKNN